MLRHTFPAATLLIFTLLLHHRYVKMTSQLQHYSYQLLDRYVINGFINRLYQRSNRYVSNALLLRDRYTNTT